MNKNDNGGISLEEIVDGIQKVAKNIYKKKIKIPAWLRGKRKEKERNFDDLDFD